MDAAFVRLFRECFPIIRAKCARILGDPHEAEDVAQETFLKLCRSGPRDEAAAARTAWIYRTGTRLAIDVWRRRRAAVEVAMGDEASAMDTPGHAPAADGLLAARRSLETLAAQVPEEELEVAVLSRLDGLTHPEIAEVTGHSERTVRRMLERLDRRLARLQSEVLS